MNKVHFQCKETFIQRFGLHTGTYVPRVDEVLRHANGLRRASDSDQPVTSVPFISSYLDLSSTTNSDGGPNDEPSMTFVKELYILTTLYFLTNSS